MQTATNLALKEVLTDAIRYWEKRRIFYNLVLVVAVIGVLAFTSFLSGAPIHYLPLIPPLFLLTVLANICYCAAYLADIPVQLSDFREAWRRWRILLWVVGTLFASVLAVFWTMGFLMNSAP